ncbi:MAG: cytochrome c [Sphingobium sp.]|nr:cytochrome c [Sphingobium sp.]
MTVRRFFAASAGLVALLCTTFAAAQPNSAKPSAPAKPDGGALFQNRCGYCHLAGGTGTMMLERRLGKGHGLLGERADLNADFVQAVVRNGLNSMPALTRVEVSDEELSAIGRFLAAPKAARK